MAEESKELAKYGLGAVKFMSAERPVFLEKSGKDWIYFGAQNDYPNYLIELKRRSVLHSTIIDKKVRLITGGGWKVDTTGLNTTQASVLNNWVKQANGKDDLNEVTKKICTDLEIFDGCYIQVIYNKGQDKKVELVHVPFEYMRRNKDCTEFYYTKHWFITGSNGNRTINKMPQDAEDFKVYKPYDPEKKEDKSQIYFYDCYSVGKDTYPLPNYLAGITAIETEARIDNFWLNFIKKGFSVSKMISFYNGIPNPEEQKKIERQIKETFTGDEGETVLVNFAQDKEHGSEVLDLAPSDFDKQYQALNETVQTKILQIHGIPNSAMVGIKTAGQLGGTNEIKDGVEEFQNYYVTPRQKILEHIFGILLKEEGCEGRLKLNRLRPLGVDLSNPNIWNLLSDEEKRDMLGLGPKPKILSQTITQTKSTYADDAVSSCIKRLMDKGKDQDQAVAICINDPTVDLEEQVADKWKVVTDIFSKYGIDKTKCQVKSSRDFEFTNDEELDASELLYKTTFADDKKKEDGLTTGLPETRVELPPTGTPKIDLMVVYSYEGPQDSKNRAFCARMLELNRYYTKADMRSINAEIRSNEEYRSAFGDLDIDVWKHRGGWYRKPGTDYSISHCRHRFVQSLILKTE